MTKKEQALLQQYRERAALTLPPYEKPKPITEYGGYRMGYFGHMGSAYGCATLGWSNGHSHRRVADRLPSGEPGDYERDHNGSSWGAGEMYETELDALRAIRWGYTEHVMRRLEAIDAKIEALEPKS